MYSTAATSSGPSLRQAAAAAIRSAAVTAIASASEAQVTSAVQRRGSGSTRRVAFTTTPSVPSEPTKRSTRSIPGFA
jgi:hypothetical protein